MNYVLRLLLILQLSLFSFSAYSQIDKSKYVPRVVESPLQLINYKWPYFIHVPPYIGVVGGYQGYKSQYYQFGLAFNFARMDENYLAGCVGAMILHKRHFTENIQSYEFEFGIYNVLAMGYNFNWHIQDDNTTFGVKPFIGISLYNASLTWGYNIYSDKKNRIVPMRHGSWELRYIIPIVPFKGVKRYTHSYY